MTKSLKDISWDVSEDVYRADSALSYSTLAKFKRTGFNGLSTLFDKVETPSLTFGSAVDSIITGGREEFESRFLVADFPTIPDSYITVVKALFSRYLKEYNSLEIIPDERVIEVAAEYGFQSNWKPETRARVLKEKCSEYYRLLYLAENKTILDTKTYQDICNCVTALKGSSSTMQYFREPTPFDNAEHLYQLKFKATLEGIEYRCMADLLIVLHDKKIIIPIDLKTSGKPEWDFYKSFIDWDYSVQARLYWRIIRHCLDQDEYFKDFELKDYRFIVVNKNTLTPLLWQYEDTQKYGELVYKDTVCPDPFELGKSLRHYLDNDCKVPEEIVKRGSNSLIHWLTK